MIAKNEGAPTPETEKDDEENSGISAGSTYLGQFIDHDLTFDPASSLDILPHLKSGKSITEDRPRLNFYHPHNDPFMPVEFSVGAYRFGHSMVRPIYRLNTTLAGRFPIFSVDPNVPNLTGFGEFPSEWAIDWRLFFDFGNHPPDLGPERIQPAYKIDSSLVNPLGDLPKARSSLACCWVTSTPSSTRTPPGSPSRPSRTTASSASPT